MKKNRSVGLYDNKLIMVAVLFVIFALFLLNSEKKTKQPVKINPVFEQPGVMKINNTFNIKLIKVYDTFGKLIAKAAGYAQPTMEVRFPWKTGVKYRIVPDRGKSVIVKTPDNMPLFSVKLHAPLGQMPHQFFFSQMDEPIPPKEFSLPSSAGETIDIMLEIEKLTDDGERTFSVSGKTVADKTKNLYMEPTFDRLKRTLCFEFDKAVITSRLRISKPGGKLLLNIESKNFKLPLILNVVNSSLKEDSISIKQWSLPTDGYGISDSRRVANQISMPNPVWNKFMTWFGVRPKSVDFREPFTYQTLVIENKTGYRMTLLIASEVLDKNSGKQSLYFKSPSAESTGGTERIIAYANIEAGKSTACVLPVYAANDTPAGTYTRHITITPLGSDKIIKTLNAQINVSRSNPLFSAWMAFITVLSFIWGVLLFAFYRKIVRKLGVRNMVLLSLLGSLQFCLQFAGGLVSNALHAVLGPFNCLVGGLLTEVMTYLIVTAILYLVPQVGAMTLAGIVSYVMSSILFGAFSLTGLLFIGNTIAFREILLYVFGITRGTSWHKAPKLLPLMVSLGIADAASTFTSLTLHTFFYRLFFADWYILLQVGVTGFAYTALGVYLGRGLGASLKKVQL